MTVQPTFQEDAPPGVDLPLFSVRESLRRLALTAAHEHVPSVAEAATRLLSSGMSRLDVYRQAVEALGELLELRLCALFLYDETSRELHLCAALGISPEVEARLCARSLARNDRDVVARCLDERRTIQVAMGAHEATTVTPEYLPLQGTQMLVAKPLLLGERPVGVLVASPRRGGHVMSETYLARLHTLADALAPTLGCEVMHRHTMEHLKSELVAVLSHELRTPLTSILGYIEVLFDGDSGPLTEEQQTYLTIIEGSARRLQRQVEHLLTLERIRGGMLEPLLQPVVVGQCVAYALESVAESAERRETTLTLSIEDDLPPVRADAGMLRRVLSHLLENAVKFAPSGGTIHVTAVREGDRAVLTVANSGSYIPEDERSSLFGAFTRGVAADRDAVQGSGLGLAIVRGLAERMDGHVWVRSDRSEGTEFALSLPLARPFKGEKHVH